MSRPPKCRRVEFLPDVNYFKPAGIPLEALEEVRLPVEEAEAIRLKDLEGLGQKQSAEKMHVSRPTFQRVLTSARQKIAAALLNGRAIRIDGGSFEMAFSRFQCRHGHEWEVPFEAMMQASPRFCPRCDTPNIKPLSPAGPGGKGKNRGQRGRYKILPDSSSGPR